MRAKLRFSWLLLLLLINFLNANYLFNDHLVSPKATNVIENIAKELKEKSSINAYLIATNDEIKRGVSVYEYIKKYSSKLKKPYVAIVFAPNSKRIHVIASNKELLKSLDKDKILNYAIKIIASKDSNSLQSKYDLGLVQAFSEMADEIAKTKGIELKNTIKEKGKWVINILNFVIIIGSLIVIWIYFIAPFFKRRAK